MVSDSSFGQGFDLGVQGGKAALLDGVSRSRQKVQVIREVMESSEARAEGLTASNQMSQIASTVVLTSRAAAIGIDGRVVSLEYSVSQTQGPSRGEEEPVATVARGDHAVEEVDSRGHAIEQIEWSAETHQVSGTIRRQGLVGDLHDGTSLFP